MILVKAGVYVKKDQGSAAASSSSNSGGRVSKADAQEALRAAIENIGAEVDDSVIDRLTGKACVYLTGVLNSIES
jgi:hypothetical protein